MAQMTEEKIKDRFLRDIAQHQMEIRHDDDLYRHVVFKQPNTISMMFSLTTTPGRLIYGGDMGCFVFERLPDMFEFFRDKKPERGPNLGYWHEKLVAIDRGGSEEKSVERFRENLENYLTQNEDMPESDIKAVKDFIEEVVTEFEDEGPEVAYRSVHEFSLPKPKESWRNRVQFFSDFWEYSDSIFTLRYQWACHAIQWGIAQYDAAK